MSDYVSSCGECGEEFEGFVAPCCGGIAEPAGWWAMDMHAVEELLRDLERASAWYGRRGHGVASGLCWDFRAAVAQSHGVDLDSEGVL
jgi:hypothetical protein